ncbi:hypothetical protein LCGC14_1634320, partial [marine sediment metagenome]
MPTQDLRRLVLEEYRKQRTEATRIDSARGRASVNPGWWVRDVLSVERVYPKQIEMVEAVKEHTQVSVCGCNSSGKDFMAARIALWWMASHEDAKVVITGPSYRQVYHVVWEELQDAYNNAKLALGGILYRTPLLRWDERRFILGFSTDRPYNLQGFHSPNLLLIITEAHAMRQSDLDALWRLNPNRVLWTGNPLSASGEFYDSHHVKQHLWHTINIDAFDTPNVIEGREAIPGLVTQEDIDRAKTNWGESSPLYRMSILNEWCEDMGQLVVVPLSLARKAAQADLTPSKIQVVACDVARYGTDRTVVVSRWGPVARIIWRVQGHDTMETVGFLNRYKAEHPQAHLI